MEVVILNRADLPHVGGTHELEGYLFGDTNISLILIDLPVKEINL